MDHSVRYMCLLPPINLLVLIVGFLKLRPSVSAAADMEPARYRPECLPWVIAAALLAWISTSGFPS